MKKRAHFRPVICGHFLLTVEEDSYMLYYVLGNNELIMHRGRGDNLLSQAMDCAYFIKSWAKTLPGAVAALLYSFEKDTKPKRELKNLALSRTGRNRYTLLLNDEPIIRGLVDHLYEDLSKWVFSVIKDADRMYKEIV